MSSDVNIVLSRAREVVGVGRAFRFLGRRNAAFDGASPLWMIERGKTHLVLSLLDEMAATP